MIDTGTLYKLPWTRDNNPNGWIEPTTFCQLKCPFCFRGADLEGFTPVHMPLDTVKREVDELIRLRRIATVSIAGGEPLMYPHLPELCDYIRSKNVEVMVLSNGLALDEPMLRTLKKHDVARVMIHIDKHQGRKGVDTEAAANEIRQAHCDLFRKVGGISLGFIQPIGLEDIDDLEVLLPFFKENADVVDLITFNRLQPVDADLLPEDQILTGEGLFERVREVYGLEYGAYLEKTRSDEISWLFGQAIFSGKEFLGSLDKHAFKFFQEAHYKKTGQYLHCTRRRHLNGKFMFYLPFNKSLRNIALRYLSLNGNRGKIHPQLILLINTPKRMQDGEYDCCKGCPDAMLFGGKLVPSCLLELVKEGVPLEAG